MKVTVHSVHFDADKKLIQFIQNRLNKLDVFHDRIIDGEVFLKLNNSTNDNRKITEIKLNIPGKEIFAKKNSKSFEEATDNVVEALRKQLRKHKEKQRKI